MITTRRLKLFIYEILKTLLSPVTSVILVNDLLNDPKFDPEVFYTHPFLLTLPVRSSSLYTSIPITISVGDFTN